MAFRVGQKVVCVDASGCASADLSEGTIYTVRQVQPPIDNATPRVLLFGSRETIGWYASRFRPLVERKTDISIFTRMLTPLVKESVQ